ncbi:MAG TPA: TolC family protein [Bryobacteraceae bacterium]|jgi:outer membrane protein TolC
MFYFLLPPLLAVIGIVALPTRAVLAQDSAVAGNSARTAGVRRITLEQVKHTVDPAVNPAARLAQLSLDAAKQHRLGVEADYFPKFGAAFANLHFTSFLGEVLEVRRPLLGVTSQVPVPILSQDQTIAALTFTQPLTPLLVVHQAVRIARADERIAAAKAVVASTANVRKAELEEIYFQLLIAQCRLKLGVSAKESFSAIAKVKELTTSLNKAMGWPEDTQLELVPPDPLIENLSLEEVANKSAAANPEVIEAEQTVVKARAAAKIAKLAYVPTIAAVSGYLFQNAIPAMPNNFGYGGVVASYNLFDFGKREHAIKEARDQLGMAEIALQMTKAKVSAQLQKSYMELERARQLSNVAQRMGSSASLLMKVSANPESSEVQAAHAGLEVEMLEADLAHRQAFANLKAPLGE